MTEQLALKYRPQTWFDFVGQRPAIWTLFQMASLGNLPNAILLHGEPGCGKTSTARVVARSANCAAEVRTAREWPCGKCPSCLAIADGSSVDVEEIDAASQGSVANIRELRQRAGMGPYGPYKAFILDEAHQLSKEAFDALLKTLEEPLEQVIFILVTTRLDKIPRTIRNRCSTFRFDPLATPAITARLEHIAAAEGYAPEAGLLAAIAAEARGGMREAIVAMDQLARAGITSLRLWRQLAGVSDFAPVLLSAAVSGDRSAMFAALREATGGRDAGYVTAQLVDCLADVLALTTAGGAVECDGEALAARQSLAERLGPAGALTVVQVLWAMQASVRTGSPATDLKLALAEISRKLAPAAAPAGPIAPGGSSQEAMTRLRGILEAPSGQHPAGPV